jgi:uncharacterized membrane protein
MAMTVLFLCFLIGCVAGLRALTAPAVVCWGARLGWLRFAGTGFGWVDHTITLALFSLAAIGEIVNDKLPKTPARTSVPQLIPRVLFGGGSGAALAVAGGASAVMGAILGIVGAVVSTFAGYHIRHALVTQLNLPDLVVALLEDLLAIAGSFYVVSHMGM